MEEITGPTKTDGTIDYLVNPIEFNPLSVKQPGTRILLLGPLGFRVDRTFTATYSDDKIHTDIDYFIQNSSFESRIGSETVSSFDVYVNGAVVAATGSNDNDKFLITLDVPLVAGDVVQYVLTLNEDGAEAWKNADASDFAADKNDIVEWDGSNWHIIWDASNNDTTTYVTNITDGQQYYWNNYYWQTAIDGYYPRGTWTITL